MRSVLLWKDMDQVAEQMDAAVFQYVGELQTESFEAFADFDLLAFDWYDVRKAGKSGKVLVYIDREDLFFFCRNEAAQQYVQGAVDTLTAGGPLNDQQLLYRFFAGLFKGDMAYLEKLEAQINGGESTILEGKAKDDAPRRIAAWRRELLHLKRYYEQLDAIFDEMCDNDNGLIEADILARLEVLGRRTGRYLQKVCALQELVAQLAEDHDTAMEWYIRALALEEKGGNVAGEAKTSHQLGIVSHLRGDLEAAKAWYARSIDCFGKVGDEVSVANTQKLLDFVTDYQRQGSHEGHAGPCGRQQ